MVALLAGLALRLWAVAAAVAVAPQRPARPSVLYIVVDDLRVELPMYGQRHIQAPHLEGLAARGMVFDRAFNACAAWCASGVQCFRSEC